MPVKIDQPKLGFMKRTVVKNCKNKSGFEPLSSRRVGGTLTLVVRPRKKKNYVCLHLETCDTLDGTEDAWISGEVNCSPDTSSTTSTPTTTPTTSPPRASGQVLWISEDRVVRLGNN